MKTQSLKTGVFILLVALTLSPSAQAIDFLQTAETEFYAPMPEQRFGIEIELMKLSQQRVVDLVIQDLGGTSAVIDKKTMRIKGSKIGNIDIKIEVNETSDDPNIDWSKNSNNVIEIVTDPILEKEVIELERTLALIEKSGGMGTEKSNPISIQVNFGMMHEMPLNKHATLLLNILRNYFDPSHQEQIKDVSNVPANRWPYLRDYSKGFMSRVMNPNYRPTAEQLFFDFFYRQTLENSMSNKAAAWSMSENEVRNLIADTNYKVDVQVIKLNQLKIASLLVAWFPNDPFAQSIVKHGWIKPAKLIEYRVANNDFRVLGKVRQAIGIFQASKNLGHIHHDEYMAKKLNMSVQEVRNTRSGLKCGRFMMNDF